MSIFFAETEISKKISGHSPKANSVLYSVFLIIYVKRIALTLKLNKNSRFKKGNNVFLINQSFFTKIISRYWQASPVFAIMFSYEWQAC